MLSADEIVGTRKCEIRNDIPREASVNIIENEGFFFALILFCKTCADSVDEGLNEGGMTLDSAGRKERGQRCSPWLVKMEVGSRECRLRHIEAIFKELQFAVGSRWSIECLIVLDIIDMDLPGIDADNWALDAKNEHIVENCRFRSIP